MSVISIQHELKGYIWLGMNIILLITFPLIEWELETLQCRDFIVEHKRIIEGLKDKFNNSTLNYRK